MRKESVGKYIAAIHRNSQMIINHKLREYDIRSGQHDFLYVIANNEGLSQKELSEILNIGKATTAKAVKNLLASGYIKRETDDEDKRFFKLYLTEKGKEIEDTINKTFDEMIEIYSSGFSEDEYDATLDTLSRIFDNVIQVTKANKE